MSSATEHAHEFSRLERSSNALLRSREAVIAYCQEHQIPYATSADFHDKIFPNPAVRDDFVRAYYMQPFAPLGLEPGASTILVFEAKEPPHLNDGVIKYHGEVASAVAEQIGSSLEPGVDALYIAANANPNYRKSFQENLGGAVTNLIEDQGVPVIIHSLGWSDLELNFDEGRPDQDAHFWRVTAFVVDSAGNGGQFQKHNIISHAPPLVVHVGAAIWQGHRWCIEGYSSANSPTFLAPVAANASIVWRQDGPLEKITGTSVAGPYSGGVLAALNRRYGAYLTREQILYAVMATCIPITQVNPFEKHTPKATTIAYKRNAAGLRYNAEYGGFGLIDPHLADHVWGHMVALTQNKPAGITIPTEERVKIVTNGKGKIKGADGLYHYKVRMPAGLCLKTTLEVEFYDKFGDIQLQSPSGTKFPMVLSRSVKKGTSFGLSTSHAWTGENLEGTWPITSTAPIKQLRLNQHHFMPGDIIHQLDVDALLTQSVPDLSHAIPMRNFGPEHSISRILHAQVIEEEFAQPSIYDGDYTPGNPHRLETTAEFLPR